MEIKSVITDMEIHLGDKVLTLGPDGFVASNQKKCIISDGHGNTLYQFYYRDEKNTKSTNPVIIL